MTYIQCELRKDDRVRVAWIPHKYAVPNKPIEIKTNGSWETGWVVAQVYGSMDGEHIHEIRDAYKYQDI